ncbi:MAG TPA: nucleotidyl transferase AbiEii/AbiGii toxin family protein [Polyangiaceae bacterium]|nr:nucleotidyl transferase AbiEii/AbiGii toxin family protein [Polyangiaceae bacterium]
MIPRANVTAWRAHAPWPLDEQVEQDLVIHRALVEIFSDADLSSALAFRGGTALHKLHFPQPARYSEDIDLVQVRAEPFGDMMTALRNKLTPWLGKPQWKQTQGRVTFVFRFESEIPPVVPLKLKVEVNTREHFTVFGYARRRFDVSNPWFSGHADVATYELEELLGTKLRALYQRKKGRDLYDMAHALESVATLDADKIIACFTEYMRREDKAISRAEFEQNLTGKISDPVFYGDVQPLLGAEAQGFDPKRAYEMVMDRLVSRIPGEPWKG